VEADTRQAFVHAAVAAPSRIDITARWARKLTVYLHDRLVDLDQPVEIRVNGVKAFSGKVTRSALTALSGARARGDERSIFAAEIRVDVPATPAALAAGERAFDELTPKRAEGALSFWEMYAMRRSKNACRRSASTASKEPPAVKLAGSRSGCASVRSHPTARWQRADSRPAISSSKSAASRSSAAAAR
jgi:hypothetical protein